MDINTLLEEFLGEDNRRKPQQSWQEPSMSWTEDSGGGPLGIAGKLAQIGGTVANFVPGGQVVGVPLTIAGSAMEGGDKGGATGALKGGIFGGAKAAGAQIVSEGMGKALESMKSPIDTGPMTGFSEKGAPYTIPGVRTEPMSTFSSQGKPLTIPASPKDYFGVDWKGGS